MLKVNRYKYKVVFNILGDSVNEYVHYYTLCDDELSIDNIKHLILFNVNVSIVMRNKHHIDDNFTLDSINIINISRQSDFRQFEYQ